METKHKLIVSKFLIYFIQKIV